ncbi:MAG TPA: SHOCT domain-containing protein [Verrucomicrobiae bacterium]|nr:SHOCT domain-containing protein [Verrucomicrobiae bacterium]
MRWNGWGWNAWGMGLGWLFWLAVIVAVVALIVYIARQPSPPANKSAEEILKERFARGEISKEEYEERLKTLRST